MGSSPSLFSCARFARARLTSKPRPCCNPGLDSRPMPMTLSSTALAAPAAGSRRWWGYAQPYV